MTAPHDHRDPPAPPQASNGNGPVAPTVRPPSKVPRSRLGELWGAAVMFAVVLLLLLIFVLENGQRADVAFFGNHGHLPMGVALLLAAVFGILLVALPGTARIVQLRILARRGVRGPGIAADIPGGPDTASRDPYRATTQ
jgi:uncharacterized integral membrane protein